ncbi:DUF4203 domain-containing protein [Candidatus Saccharibacteria bacterium]|nr:DUF4203 domain-containing protein [Candidatus Saccharibacteria bacterium]
MGELVVGLFAILVGALFCFSGNIMMRILFPFMGFFAGFSVGAGAIAAISGDGFLGTVLGWTAGLFVGLLFALLAYFFYSFAIVLAFAGLGFSITSGLLSILHMDWNWLVVILGTVVGIIFGIFAIISSMPLIVLVIATAFFGSAVIIYGLMLVLNTASLGDFSSGAVWQDIRDRFGLYLLWIGLAIAGSMSQTTRLVEESQKMRELWESSATFDEFLSKQQPKKR